MDAEKVERVVEQYRQTSGADGLDFLRLSNLELDELPTSAMSASAREVCRSVERLELSHNRLTTLPEDFDQVFPNIRTVFLLKNRFTTLPESLARCSKLNMLSFKSCRLEGELDASRLPPNLEWLILTDNKIQSLSPDFPTRTRYVRKMLLACNAITKLPPMHKTGTFLESIELLRLAHNQFENFPEELYDAPKLAFLGMGGNPCTDKCSSLNALNDDWRLELQDFDIEDNPTLGKGASGDVYLARKKVELPGDPRLFAIKKYRTFESSDGSVLDEMKCALVLKDLPGLIPVLGFFGPSSNGTDDGQDSSFGLVMEAVRDMKPLGATPTFLTITRDVFCASNFTSLVPVAAVLRQICSTVSAIHRHGYTHNDLYAHNILISSKNEGLPEVRLVDFGAASPITDPRVQTFEVRAFGYLIEDLLQASIEVPEESSVRAELERVSQLATDLNPKSRPSFEALEGMLSALPIAATAECVMARSS